MPGNYYDSTILTETPLRCYKPETVETTEEVNDTSSVNVFAQNLSQTQENKVDLSEIDIDELIKKYKKNPLGVLDELGIEFTDKQKAELKAFITNKKSLKSFLKLIKDNNALNSNDIISATRNVKKFKPKGFFKRTFNVIKTVFTDGIGEAVDLAKSETTHYAGKLGRNMNEIRSERTDFSSDAVADVGDTITQQPETKESVMHFVLKNNKDGSKLYTQDDVIHARNIIVDNIDEAQEFTANTVELESIQDTNGFIKYKGSTIINVGDRMTKNQDVKSTMLNVAKKSDMTDEYLENTTSNLAQNHSMASVIDYIVGAKDQNGKDKFTAFSVSTESSHLVDKNSKYCEIVTEAIKEVSKNQNISSENILSTAHEAAKFPEKKNEIIANAVSNKTTLQAEQKTATINSKQEKTFTTQQAATNELKAEQQQAATNPITTINKSSTANENFTSNNVLNLAQVAYQNTEKEIVDKAVINGETYERSEVLRELRKKFGVSAEKVLNKIESDASFIEVMKQYGGNKTIIAALVEDPYLITKIKKVSGSIGVNELADVVKLCTDSTSTNVMLEALQHSSPQEAMLITKKSKIFNLKDDALDILSSSRSTVNKKQQIDELLLNGAGSKAFIG